MARRNRPATPITTRFKRWLALLATLLLLWLGGALTYFNRAETSPMAGDERTDAIVVLTGGTARMATALRLLNENKADRLLVSGVGPTVTKASLIQAVLPTMPDAAQASSNWQGIDLQLLFECCVDLGFEATDTAGNAVETAAWAKARGFNSIRLVTANYHMPRSLVEFRRRLPEATILPHPVRSEAMRVEDWWRRSTNAAFLLGEYTKYVAALLRARLDIALAEPLDSGSTAAQVPQRGSQP